MGLVSRVSIITAISTARKSHLLGFGEFLKIRHHQKILNLTASVKLTSESYLLVHSLLDFKGKFWV